MSRALALFVLTAAFAAPPRPDPLAMAVERKFETIENGKAHPGSIFVFSAAELEAWARYKVPMVVPEGVRQPHLQLGYGRATADALVDFVKVREGQGLSTNWLIAKLIEGEKLVRVSATVRSARGQGTVHLDRVEIGELAVSGETLQIMIRTFFLPLYPNAKIDEPFELADGLDRIEVAPTQARAIMKR